MSDLNTTFVDGSAGGTPIDAAYLNAVNKRLRSRLPVIDVVEDHGAKIDGTTDDTAAWQAAINSAAAAGGGRIIASKVGVSIIGGALADTGGANAQLVLPAVDYVDTKNIVIEIVGPHPPPNVYSVIGPTPLADGGLVLKSTLTAGSGGALLGGVGPSGTFGGFTNVTLRLENLTVRMPSNPTHTALNLSRVACADIDNVSIDTANFYVDSLALQTTSTSYGLRLPGNDNGAHVRLGQVDVVGFYNGIEFSEHTSGQYVAVWGCRRGAVALEANHASKFQRLGMYHCKSGIVGAGSHYVDVDQYNIEKVSSGTWATTYDVDDASNFLHGAATWSVVMGGVGQDSTFTKNGGSSFNTARVGTAPAGGGGGGSTQYVGRDRKTAAAGNDTLTLGATPVANSLLLWVNNTIKWPGTDYALSGSMVTFTTPLAASDVVLDYYLTTTASPGAATLTTAVAPGVSFSTPADVAAAGDTANTNPVTLGSKLAFASAGTITKLRLYARVAGTYKMRLQNASGTVLATPANVVVSSAGWVDFPISYAVTAGTQYVVAGFFPAGQWKNYDFGVSDVTRNGITFSESRYAFAGDITDPATGSGHVFYFVDVAFA